MGLAFGIDPFLILALGLLVLGVIGSVAPMIPGALLSVIGVLVYWWSTGYADPSTVFVAGVVIVGLLAVFVDYFAGAVSAKAGGASTLTMLLAAVAGLVLFFVTGPLGIILGVAGTVFVVEFIRTDRVEDSARAAFYATAGMLASTAVQVVITLSILVAFIIAVLV